MMRFIKNLYQYRELLKNNIKKDIRGKYKGAWLGILWSFINPLLMLAIYSIVFSEIMKVDIKNYSMFMFVAIIPWTFFTSTITNGTSAMITNSGIIKKVYFPREIILVSFATSGAVTFLISCLIMVAFLLLTGVGLSVYALIFPLILILQYFLTLGIILILSAITVYVRDIEHFVNIILMALFYGTPIVYSMEMVPDKIAWILYLNPMTSIISAYRDILFYKRLPDFNGLGVLAIVIFLLVAVGLFVFDKLQRRFAEEL